MSPLLLAAALSCGAALQTTAGGTFLDEPFESEPVGWKYVSDRKVWRIEPGVGRNGSSALVWEYARTNNAQPEMQLPLPFLTPGRRIEATFRVKTEGFKGKVEGTIAWNDRKTGRWLGGSGGLWIPWGDKRLKPDDDGWTQVRILTPDIPNAAGSAMLEMYMSRGATGRVLIDDLKLRLVPERRVGVVSTSVFRGVFERGDVRLAAQFWAPPDVRVAGSFAYTAEDGRTVTVPARVQAGVMMTASVPAEAFRMGRQRVEFTLKKAADGTVLGSGNTEVTRVAALPPRRFRIDEHQRLIVDGKPFFPIGMWWSKDTLKTVPDALARYAEGPFNALLTYDDTITTDEMDRYHAHGLKVLVALKDFFHDPVRMGCTFPPAKLKTKADEIRLLTETVRRLQKHPALLGWYTCDEIPGVSAWRLEEHHRLLNEIDDHIQFADTSDHANTIYFLNAADVVQPDPFWGQSGSNYRMKWVADRCHEGHDPLRGVRASWSVADTFFALTWDNPGKPYRLPNVAETRALAWLPISMGANGLMQYSYGQFLNRCKRGQVPWKTFDSQFKIVCQVSAEIRALSDILLLPPGPDVTAGGDVTARTYSDGSCVWLLVCNALEKETTCRLAVKGLRGPAGKVYGEGSFVIDAQGVSCTLPPLGVAIVKTPCR